MVTSPGLWTDIYAGGSDSSGLSVKIMGVKKVLLLVPSGEFADLPHLSPELLRITHPASSEAIVRSGRPPDTPSFGSALMES